MGGWVRGSEVGWVGGCMGVKWGGGWVGGSE